MYAFTERWQGTQIKPESFYTVTMLMLIGNWSSTGYKQVR